MSYTDNPGFGGPTIFRYTVTPRAVLDVSDAERPFREVADALGWSSETVEEWHGAGLSEIHQLLTWRPLVGEALAEAGYDWIAFRDDFPENAITWWYLGEDDLEPDDPEGETVVAHRRRIAMAAPIDRADADAWAAGSALPEPYYHGTRDPSFDELEERSADYQYGGGIGSGVYVTPDQSYAREYYGPHVYEVRLKVANPFSIDDNMSPVESDSEHERIWDEVLDDPDGFLRWAKYELDDTLGADPIYEGMDDATFQAAALHRLEVELANGSRGDSMTQPVLDLLEKYVDGELNDMEIRDSVLVGEPVPPFYLTMGGNTYTVGFKRPDDPAILEIDLDDIGNEARSAGFDAVIWENRVGGPEILVLDSDNVAIVSDTLAKSAQRAEGGETSRDEHGNFKWGKRAAGLLIRRGDGRVLLTLRAADVEDPGVWGVPGGRVEPGESEWEGALHESEEELGSLPPLRQIGERVYRSGGFTYTTFIVEMDEADAEAFDPELNWESTAWDWWDPLDPPSPLHPGVAALLPGVAAATPVARPLERFAGILNVPPRMLKTITAWMREMLERVAQGEPIETVRAFPIDLAGWRYAPDPAAAVATLARKRRSGLASIMVSIMPDTNYPQMGRRGLWTGSAIRLFPDGKAMAADPRMALAWIREMEITLRHELAHAAHDWMRELGIPGQPGDVDEGRGNAGDVLLDDEFQPWLTSWVETISDALARTLPPAMRRVRLRKILEGEDPKFPSLRVLREGDEEKWRRATREITKAVMARVPIPEPNQVPNRRRADAEETWIHTDPLPGVARTAAVAASEVEIDHFPPDGFEARLGHGYAFCRVVGWDKVDAWCDDIGVKRLPHAPGRVMILHDLDMHGSAGEGNGRVLFERVLAHGRSLGARTVVLESLPESVGFWRHMGFEEVAPAGKNTFMQRTAAGSDDESEEEEGDGWEDDEDSDDLESEEVDDDLDPNAPPRVVEIAAGAVYFRGLDAPPTGDDPSSADFDGIWLTDSESDAEDYGERIVRYATTRALRLLDYRDRNTFVPLLRDAIDDSVQYDDDDYWKAFREADAAILDEIRTLGLDGFTLPYGGGIENLFILDPTALRLVADEAAPVVARLLKRLAGTFEPPPKMWEVMDAGIRQRFGAFVVQELAGFVGTTRAKSYGGAAERMLERARADAAGLDDPHRPFSIPIDLRGWPQAADEDIDAAGPRGPEGIWVRVVQPHGEETSRYGANGWFDPETFTLAVALDFDGAEWALMDRYRDPYGERLEKTLSTARHELTHAAQQLVRAGRDMKDRGGLPPRKVRDGGDSRSPDQDARARVRDHVLRDSEFWPLISTAVDVFADGILAGYDGYWRGLRSFLDGKQSPLWPAMRPNPFEEWAEKDPARLRAAVPRFISLLKQRLPPEYAPKIDEALRRKTATDL